MCCSVAVAISHWLLGPANAQILGLSGVVFAMMMLNGGLSRKEMWRTHTHMIHMVLACLAVTVACYCFEGHDSIHSNPLPPRLFRLQTSVGSSYSHPYSFPLARGRDRAIAAWAF